MNFINAALYKTESNKWTDTDLIISDHLTYLDISLG